MKQLKLVDICDHEYGNKRKEVRVIRIFSSMFFTFLNKSNLLYAHASFTFILPSSKFIHTYILLLENKCL